jgi:hypothetical protein
MEVWSTPLAAPDTTVIPSLAHLFASDDVNSKFVSSVSLEPTNAIASLFSNVRLPE